MKKTVISAVIAAAAITSVPAFGDPPPWAPAHGYRHHHERYDVDDYRDGYNGGYQRQYYRTDNGISYWRGDNGRYYCRRSNGTTGILIGGVAGALLGRSIDRYGDRSTGTILGAAAGALLGREVERSSARCR